MSQAPAIVIPVHNAAGALADCVVAVQRTVPDSVPVIVIDDASTDPGVDSVLGKLPAHWRIERQPRNLGFVATANRGFRAAGDRDVVLLNSDTVPAGEWLTRMARCVRSDPAIASATPFTNNGEIASLPALCRPSPVPDDPERWARACADAGPPVYPELPTAVGFCMYLRRACLERIGDFDEQAFGRGYGEENDWCMRASRAGWRHVLCDDAFVAHRGNASFGPLGLAPDEAAMQALVARHPDYPGIIARFIEADPLAPVRERVLAHL